MVKVVLGERTAALLITAPSSFQPGDDMVIRSTMVAVKAVLIVLGIIVVVVSIATLMAILLLIFAISYVKNVKPVNIPQCDRRTIGLAGIVVVKVGIGQIALFGWVNDRGNRSGTAVFELDGVNVLVIVVPASMPE